MTTIRTCRKCGFILGTRPGLKEIDGVCLACINAEKKKTIDFTERQEWLTKYIAENRTHADYDCVIAVSGGKDSTMIVSRLIKDHDVRNPLLVSVMDEFSSTKAGEYNRRNISERFNLDHIYFRCQPRTFCERTLSDFENELHPLKWIEERIYKIPVDIARSYGIKLVFFGENSSFEYGSGEELNIFHSASDEKTRVIFMGAIYPYSITDSLARARQYGFRDLDDFGEWPRQGSIENYTQIDSIAYIIQLWTKFVKFGFQRVSDIACRFVRDRILTLEQARLYIKERDHICDPAARRDFCLTLGITEQHFNNTVDRHANQNLVVKDVNGVWRRKDFL